MTPERLRNIALWYCQRYIVSEARLRDQLRNRLYREVPDENDRAALATHIPDIAADMARAGLVNDREAASSKLRSALRAGYAAPAAVDNAARAAQVDRETVAAELETALGEALPEMRDATGDPAENAPALATLALKRARRGPFRSGEQDEKTRQRDANWLLRRGFRYAEVRKAMDIDPETF